MADISTFKINVTALIVDVILFLRLLLTPQAKAHNEAYVHQLSKYIFCILTS